MDTLTKQVRQLRLYVGVLTVIVLVCLIAIVLISGNNARRSFDQLTVHRINIVEPNGRLSLVMDSNSVQGAEVHVMRPQSRHIPSKVRVAIDALVDEIPQVLARI